MGSKGQLPLDFFESVARHPMRSSYLWILGVAYGDIIFGVLCIVGDFGRGTVLYVGGRVQPVSI